MSLFESKNWILIRFNYTVSGAFVGSSVSRSVAVLWDNMDNESSTKSPFLFTPVLIHFEVSPGRIAACKWDMDHCARLCFAKSA